jgi:hypothetical protein
MRTHSKKVRAILTVRFFLTAGLHAILTEYDPNQILREKKAHLPPTLTPKKQAIAEPPSSSPLAIKIEPYQKAKAHVE